MKLITQKGEYEMEVPDDQKEDELKVSCSPGVSLSISCHVSQFLKMCTKISRPPVGWNSDEVSFHGEWSSHEAILKLERRLKRTRKKIRKKKLISDFGMKAAIVKNKDSVLLPFHRRIL